ncbi:hypothetical protein HispidOSU_024961 [Sigmodon hispidus]
MKREDLRGARLMKRSRLGPGDAAARRLGRGHRLGQPVRGRRARGRRPDALALKGRGASSLARPRAVGILQLLLKH